MGQHCGNTVTCWTRFVQFHRYGIRRRGYMRTQGRTAHRRRRGGVLGRVESKVSVGICGGLEGQVKVDVVDQLSVDKIDNV